LEFPANTREDSGEALPSKLLVKKTAAAVGVPVERLQLAAQRDRMLTKDSIQLIAETTVRSQRVNLFEPLINALAAEQVPAAYAMLKGLVKAAKAKRAVPLAILPVEDGLKHVLPKKRAKKKARAA
jgi:hypothetical protein